MKTLIFNANKKLTNLLNGKIKEVVEKSGEWALSLSDAELATLGYIITREGLDEDIDAHFEESESDSVVAIETDFKINPTQKKIFLAYLSDIWESDVSIYFASKFLEEIEEFEAEYGKQFIEFDEDETIAYIQGMRGRNSFHSLKRKINVGMKYFDFYMSPFGLNKKQNFWRKYNLTKTLVKIVKLDNSERNLTKEDLLNLSDSTVSPQQSIIPILLFEGLSYSKGETDTLRFLKKEDIKENGIFIKAYTNDRDESGFKLSVDRFIDLDEDVMDVLIQASQSRSIARIWRSELGVLELKDSVYVLRAAEGKRSSSGGDEISYGGVYERLQYCHTQLEAMGLVLDSLGRIYISNCGKSHYIKKYMNEGCTEREAVIKTLKRFGEWNYGDNTSEEEEARLKTNKARISRLTHSYSMYLNK